MSPVRLEMNRETDKITEKLELQSLEDDILISRHQSRCDYASIIHALNANSTITKIKVLDKLLAQILDTKQKLWMELSQSLRKCFVSPNNEIFIRSLKIHHRIISIPNSSCDGYLSLLKSTFLLLSSRHFTDSNKTRILQTLHLVIAAQSVVIKSLLHASHAVIEEIVTAFVNVLTFKSVFEWFGILDPKSLWLRHLSYGSHIRTTFYQTLKEKFPEFLKQIGTNFVKKPDEESAIYGRFLLELWRFETNLPLETTIEIILEMAPQKLKNLDQFTDLFTQNSSLLTHKVLEMLIEPLSCINRNNIKSLIEANLYIFDIVANIARSPNFSGIFGISSKFRKGRRQATRNLPQRITDLTALCVKEKDAKNMPRLLNCCVAIFNSHSGALTHVNPARLVESLHEFYRLSWRSDRGAILHLFKFFYERYTPILRILDGDEILTDLFSFYSPDDLKIVINRSSYDFLKRHQVVVKTYLEEIFASGDDGDYTNFVLFIFSLKLTTRSVVAFLADDDEGTVVENGNQSLTLTDLIEKSLDWTDSSEEFLGLLVMKVLIMNLDLLLYFQANHQIQDKFGSFEEENVIVDAQSSLRRDIISSTETVGFPTELKNLSRSQTELGEFLDSGTNSSDFGWLVQARRALKNSLNKFDPAMLPVLLDQIPKITVYRKIELAWPPADSVYYQLHPEDFSGITLIVNYGLKTGLLTNDVDNHNDNLTLLIKQSRAFLGHKPEIFTNFDWFVGIIFLICSGNYDQCKSVLINFTNTPVTSLVWSTFGKEFDHVLQENFYQYFGVVLEESSSCFEALKMLGIAPDILAQSWLSQCFFNLLPFGEIVNFLAFSVLHPAECLMYYLVAIFVHLEERICTVTHSPTVESILDMTDMSSFKLADSTDLIDKLIKKYRNSHKF